MAVRAWTAAKRAGGYPVPLFGPDGKQVDTFTASTQEGARKARKVLKWWREDGRSCRRDVLVALAAFAALPIHRGRWTMMLGQMFGAYISASEALQDKP